MAAKKKRKYGPKPKFDAFFRFWAGLSILSFIVTVAGSALAGAHVITITYRGVLVIVILGLVGRIIIKSWSSWEEMNRSEAQTRRR